MNEFLMWLGGIVTTIAIAIIGGVLAMIFGKLDGLEKDLDAHKLYSANNYSTKTDVEKVGDRLFRYMERLEDKIDGRSPRPKPSESDKE